MNTRISAALLILSLSILAGCGGIRVVKTEPTVPPPAPLSLIATVSNHPGFANLLAEELSQKGYGILNQTSTASVLKKMDLDANQMGDPQNILLLKDRRIDALMNVTVEMGPRELLNEVTIRVTGTKSGEPLAALLWRNAWSGAAGSPADTFMKTPNALAAKKVAEALTHQLGSPGPKGTVFMDNLVAARKVPNASAGQDPPAGLSAADIARIAKAVQGSSPQEPSAPSTALPLSPAPNFQSPVRPDDLAIVVGIEAYSELPKAAYAERDAAAVKAHLRALGVPERNVVFLAGAKASKSALEKNLEVWLPRMVKPESRVYFYFSGHGAPDAKTGLAYLVPWDGDPNFLEATAYPVKKLYEKLGALSARQILVAMDACFTGGGGRSVLASGARPLVGRIETGRVSGNVTVLTASAASEIAGSLDDKGHGAFTYFLLEGLDGAAKDSSGHVTAKSLLDYLTPHVKDEARRLNRDQTPQFLGENLTLR